MSVFIKTISDLVALLLQALRLSVVLPATVFVGLNLTFVLPRFENTRLYQLLGVEEDRIPLTFILFFSVLILAYTLAVANIPIIRIFEGYPWMGFWPGGRLLKSNVRRVKYLQNRIKKLDEEIRECVEKAEIAEREARQEKSYLKFHRAWRYAKTAQNEVREKQMTKNLFNGELSFFYPHHQTWRLLPTRLGNVIASAEEYSSHLYGLDAVTFWPFLSPILSEKGYAVYVEREKAAFDFLLNMVVVTLTFGLELIYVDYLLSEFAWDIAISKLLLTLIIAFALYLLSIQGALSWGYTIRVALVFYRDHLRAQLGLKKPEGFYQERIMWKQTTRFLLDHDVTPGEYIFDYSSPEKDQASLEVQLKLEDPDISLSENK